MTNQTSTDQLPTIPCAQAHNTWNRGHQAHDWLSKQTYPSVDAHCPGSLLGTRVSTGMRSADGYEPTAG
jgi:hypothetical protein